MGTFPKFLRFLILKAPLSNFNITNPIFSNSAIDKPIFGSNSKHIIDNRKNLFYYIKFSLLFCFMHIMATIWNVFIKNVCKLWSRYVWHSSTKYQYDIKWYTSLFVDEKEYRLLIETNLKHWLKTHLCWKSSDKIQTLALFLNEDLPKFWY